MRKVEIACHNVFYSYVSLVHQNAALCGNGLIFCFPCFHLVLFFPPPSLSQTTKQSRSNLSLLPAFAFGLGRDIYGLELSLLSFKHSISSTGLSLAQ